MKSSGFFPDFQNAVYDIQMTVDSPLSGFEFSLMQTGMVGPDAKSFNLITFSGQEGYLFDQSGNFFGGYDSGIPFSVEVHHDFLNKTFTYYQDGKLIANNMGVTGAGSLGGNVNLAVFTKHGDSVASVSASGSIG